MNWWMFRRLLFTAAKIRRYINWGNGTDYERWRHNEAHHRNNNGIYIRFQTIRSIRYSVFYCIIKYTFAVFIYWLWLNEPHFAFCVCSVIASIHSFVSIYYSIWKCFQMNNSSYRAFNWMRRLTADAGPLMHQICRSTVVSGPPNTAGIVYCNSLASCRWNKKFPRCPSCWISVHCPDHFPLLACALHITIRMADEWWQLPFAQQLLQNVKMQIRNLQY